MRFLSLGVHLFLLVFCALTQSFPARNKDWMRSLSLLAMKPTALHTYNVSKCTSVSKFSMRVLQRNCHNFSVNVDLLDELALGLSKIRCQ